MTMKYTQLLTWFNNRSLLTLAIVLASAIAFTTRAQAIETGHASTGNVGDTTTATCTIATPALDLSPNSQNTEAGSNLEYTVSLTNNDNPPCSLSRFEVTVTYLPSGWTGELSTSTLNLSPGATGMVTLSVTPANDPPADSVNLQVAVSDANEPTHAKAATATYPADDTAPVVDNDAAAVPTEPDAGETSNEVIVSSDPGTDNLGVASDQVARDGVTTQDSANTAETLTQQLVGLNTRLQYASPIAKAQVLDELQAVATERRALLAKLIESDPGAVLRVAQPPGIRAGMPTEVQDLLEDHLTLSGELEVLYEDYPDGSARLRHFLKTNGKRIALHFKAEPPRLLSGTPVSASGVLLGDAMALGSGESILTLAAGGGKNGGSNGGTPAPVPGTLGEQKTLVILVNFQDNPLQPYTPADAESMMFGTTSDFYLENSFQQTWLSGDVVGWFTTASTSTVCDTGAIATQAEAAASAAGIDVAAYQHLVYAFPHNDFCGFWGLSSVGGNPSRTWINGNFELGVTAHEFGHALGLWHSHAMDCDTATVGANCTTYEYGDNVDMMGGSSRYAHFNAFQKERLGWLNAGASPPITTVEASGGYTIEAYELAGSGPKALKILKSVDPSTGERTWYYVESRQAIGFDAGLANDSFLLPNNILNGVLIRSGNESQGSYQLDMTPASDSSYLDWRDPALPVSQSFQDPDSGVTVTTDWVTETQAAVTVRFDDILRVSTDRSTYTSNQSVSIVATASRGASPVANAAVTFKVTKPNGEQVNASATTRADGTAVYKLRLKRQDPGGTYEADADTNMDGTPSSASTRFTVY